MTSDPSEIGTLIVVILKARNLPNKRHLGKQAPYCTVQFNGETRRTKVIKRGGQHPEWDEEVRFTIFEDDATALNDGDAPPPPPKDGRPRKIKGGKSMHMCCFADDPREPDLIGECKVDLTEVFTKGETDEWFTLNHKDRYCGEVYLELTFWSNAPPPQKKAVPVNPAYQREYGGTGEFMPLADEPYGSDGGYEPQLSESSSRNGYETIRPSNSSARIPLYQPAYEPRAEIREGSVDRLVNDFGELGVGDHARRSSTYPPLNTDYTGYNGTMGSVISTQSWHSDQGPTMDGRPSHYQRSHRMSDASARPYTPYQAPYETGAAPMPPSSSFSQQPTPPARRPRYSMPVASSGFVPVGPSTEPSSFMQAAQMAPDMTGFQPPPSRMSMSSYAPSVPSTPAPPPSRGPRHSHSPMPSSSFAHLPAPTPAPSMPSSVTAPGQLNQLQSYGVPPPGQIPFPQQPGYGPLPPSSAPPVQYPPPPPSTLPHVPHSAPPPMGYQNGAPPPPASHVMPPTQVPGSRPLPLPQSAPQLQGSHSLPTPPGPPGPLVPSSSFDRIPPPPPLPSSSPSALSLGPPAPSSLPPPPGQRIPSGRPSLPLPPPGSSPSGHMPASAYESGPPTARRSSSQHLALQQQPPSLPPAPPPLNSQAQYAYPGPPPRPPTHMLAPPGAGPQYSQGGY